MRARGPPPASLASHEGAAALAAAAYRHAAALAEFGDSVVGVGLTAALATERERKGEDRIHVVCDDGCRHRTASLTLPRGGTRDRGAQDGLASRLLLRTLAGAVGVGGPPLALGVTAGETVSESVVVHTPYPIAALLSGAITCVEYGPAAATPPIVDAPRGAGRLYLPGSFNPLHEGHVAGLASAVAAAAATSPPGLPPPAPTYELSIVNADKGGLSAAAVRARVAQFTGVGATIVLTRAPLFCDKAALLGPGASFVVGVDTADRLVDPKYYGGGAAGAAAALARVAAGGGKVYVLPRVDGDTLRTLADVAIPPAIAALDLFVPVDGFRQDVSSTALRAAGRGVVDG